MCGSGDNIVYVYLSLQKNMSVKPLKILYAFSIFLTPAIKESDAPLN
jgi:hypothetical protein